MRSRAALFGLMVFVSLLLCASPVLLSADAQSGTEPIRISHDLAPNEYVASYSISPDRRLVAYCSMVRGGGPTTLWVTPINGSNPAASVPGASGCVPVQNWIGSNGQRLMVGSAAPYPSSSQIPVLVETTAPYASRPLFVLPNGYSWYRQIRWSNDGQWVFFSASPDQVSQWVVFVAPTSGASPARQLTPTMAAGRSGSFDFALTSDLRRLVTVTDELVAGQAELLVRSLPTDLLNGAIGSPTRLNGPMVANGDVGFYSGGSGTWMGFAFTPDQSRALYFADQDVDEQHALYSAHLDGSGTPVRLSPVLGANDDFFWLWSLVDNYAWYMVRNSSTFRTSIYRAPIDGPSSSTALMADNGNNFGFWPVANGAKAMISGSHFVNNSAEAVVLVGPMDGQPADLVSVPLAYPSGVFNSSPDANTLVHSGMGDLERLDLREDVLSFVPLSGTGGYPLLSNLRAVFSLNNQILSRALYGTSSNVLLSGSLPIDGSAANYQITSDDQWVTFLSPATLGSNLYSLYSTGLGSTAPTPTPSPSPTPSPTPTLTPTIPAPTEQHMYLPGLWKVH